MKVLLAPTHAMADGSYDDHLPPLNARMHLFLSSDPSVDLTVRYVHQFGALGIDKQPHVTYVEGNGMVDDAVRAVDDADLVVAGPWTLPTLAVARGVPTIMYGAWKFAPYAWSLSPFYDEVVRYPLEADHVASRQELYNLMLEATTDDSKIREWRRRNVGDAFNAAEFVYQFERAVKEW